MPRVESRYTTHWPSGDQAPSNSDPAGSFAIATRSEPSMSIAKTSSKSSKTTRPLSEPRSIGSARTTGSSLRCRTCVGRGVAALACVRDGWAVVSPGFGTADSTSRAQPEMVSSVTPTSRITIERIATRYVYMSPNLARAPDRWRTGRETSGGTSPARNLSLAVPPGTPYDHRPGHRELHVDLSGGGSPTDVRVPAR